MFEGLVRKLLRGCLGHYVKDIQLDKLNYNLQEVVLNDVNLNLEAFDYLQLPLSLKQGRVGRLIIKIPWKLGWDPIIITLEDVFICACQWDDHEWSKDAIERRELAAKKAKLATAELAKLSKLVSDSKAGKSFKSYLMAKILDGIQVSIRNVHFLYCDRQSKLAQTVLGLRFSSLTVLKLNPVGTFSGNSRGPQVNKTVEILALEIYCGSSKETDLKSWISAQFECHKSCHLLAPVDISLSLLINRSGVLEKDAPQYSISAESPNLVLSLDEVQLQQVFMLWDNMHVCCIKERYGRYHPWDNPLSGKFNGWQIAWWHYAQQSVLSDIRQKLKKTSWRYFRERMTHCRKYVNLYKAKLKFLQQEQLNSEYIFEELDQMEKKLDIDDILSYRAIAEYEMQVSASNHSGSYSGMAGTDIGGVKLKSDDCSSNWSRGWLYWLPHGMLGAGGTEDSTKFSGLVSEDDVRDIHEATDFDPGYSSHAEAAASGNFFLSAIRFSLPQITTTFRSMKFDREIAVLTLSGLILKFKGWQDFATISTSFKFVELTDPSSNKVIVHTKQVVKSVKFDEERPSININFNASPLNEAMQLVVKVSVEPLDATLDLDFFSNFLGFYCLLSSFEFHHQMVLSSLNGIEDVKARLLSKAEYIFSFHQMVSWDVSFINTVVKIPWTSAYSEQYEMVLECGSLLVVSTSETSSFDSLIEEELCMSNSFLNSVCTSNFCSTFQLPDLYDLFEVKLNDFEMRVELAHYPRTKLIFEKFGFHSTVAVCTIPDEPILKQFQMHVLISSFCVCLSPAICGAILGLMSYIKFWSSKFEHVIAATFELLAYVPNIFSFYIIANVESVFCSIDLLNDGDNEMGITLTVQEADARYSLSDSKKCCISLKKLEIFSALLNGEDNRRVLCSSRNQSAACQYDMVGGFWTQNTLRCEGSSSGDWCFLLHYESCRTVDFTKHGFSVFLNNVDLHCYPYIIGLLVGFSDRIPACGLFYPSEFSIHPMKDSKCLSLPSGFAFQRFGFSNFCDSGSSELAGITVDHFPFITIYNSGSLGCLESSLIHSISDWRNYFRLIENKMKAPVISSGKRSDFVLASPLKCTNGTEAFFTTATSSGATMFLTDLNASGISVHFHDSSSIVATVTVPVFTFSHYIHEDSFDMLCSAERLTLSSPWWSQKLHGSLWGPLLPNLSPVVNIRVKKEWEGVGESWSSHFALSISIQHVLCILPPEFLAILIGYFSLSDWSHGANAQPGAVKGSSFIFKFEILDSTLIVPVSSDDNQLLKLELQQLYCSFFKSFDVFSDIPVECWVPEHKIGDEGEDHCLNIFGRELSFSLLLPVDMNVGTLFDQIHECRKISLIDPLCADIWVRIPSENGSSCISVRAPTRIMVRMPNCQVNAEDRYIFQGLEALVVVINQFSSVEEDSKFFTDDVLQFLRSRENFKEKACVLDNASGLAYAEIKCCVNSLSIKFGRTHDVPNSARLIAQTDMQFTWAASLKNNILLWWNATFFSLLLYSFPYSRVLAQCISVCSNIAVLGIQFSKSSDGGCDLCIVLPSLNMWMHFSDWAEFIDIFNSCIGPSGATSLIELSSMSSINSDENVMATVLLPSVQSQTTSNFLSHLKFEDISITFYFPALFCEEFSKVDVKEKLIGGVSSNIVEGNCVTVTLHSKSSELIFGNSSVRILANVEKAVGAVVLYDGRSSHSWPFFQLFQIHTKVEMRDILKHSVSVTAEVFCDGLDVWLSHWVFFFWRDIPFEIPEAGMSRFVFGAIRFESQCKKVSLLLMDGRWGFNGPLMEILLRNLQLHADATPISLNGSIHSELTVNYNNIQKVLWEPFVEPWKFQLNMVREQGKSALLNVDVTTDIVLESVAELNLNFTESLIESTFRVTEMVKDAWGLTDFDDCLESPKFFKHQLREHVCKEKFAPYIIQNLTSLPLLFYICQGPVNVADSDVSMLKEGQLMLPGSSFPLYINETPEPQFFHYSPHSSDKFNEKPSHWATHRYISVKLDGTNRPSSPISIDLVGLTYFEVDFSNPLNKTEAKKLDNASKHYGTIEGMTAVDGGSIVPVVVDVSVQHHCKLVRLYSTVVLLNATSVPFELRFDIPFGVSPKILDPIYPGQEFPLPLHLAEAGCVRWRPLGSFHLWSEAHSMSNILSQENKIGYWRNFVCYPSNPSCDPFRCCMSVNIVSLLSPGMPSKVSTLDTKDSGKLSVDGCHKKNHLLDVAKQRHIHYLTLSSPFIVKNFLPEEVFLIIESGGIIRRAPLTEVETPFFHADASHDIGMEIHVSGFKPSTSVFPRSETFSVASKFIETMFSVSETITLDSDLCPGPLHVTVEKTMDVFSGARVVAIYVPYLLYNCVGFPLIVSDSGDERSGIFHAIPSCYSFGEQKLRDRKDGLSLLSSNDNSCSTVSYCLNSGNMFSKSHLVSSRKLLNPLLGAFPGGPVFTGQLLPKCEAQDVLHNCLNSASRSVIESNSEHSNSTEREFVKVKPYMYSPFPETSPSEIIVRVAQGIREHANGNISSCSWSNSFGLVPPTGPATVLVPQSLKNAAYIISVSSCSVGRELLGKTEAITFQPRFVLSNACSKNMFFKQKGTGIVFQLGTGMHTHLHWMDVTRELLVSICFSEPGWEWSGCFMPEHLGDTQVKMRNYDSGAVKTIRVEVQNADILSKDEKILGNPHGNSGTNLILLSDDDTGFMPHRIDNFSKEILRIYQQNCERFAKIVHPYTSCPYSWDEPYYPHRLIVEVPGERVLGSFSLDVVKEFKSVNLSSTVEKPGRTLLVSLCAEGAKKVLKVVDSSYHILRDVKVQSNPWFKEKRENKHTQDTPVVYREKISMVIPFIGISLIDSSPKEFVFACAKNTTVDFLQTLEQQKFSFQISNLQIDNQLHNTQYPVILSFDHQLKNHAPVHIKILADELKSRGGSLMQIASGAYCDPSFSLAVVRWRNKDSSCESFEYVSFRVSEFHLELDQEMIFSLFDFSRVFVSRIQCKEFEHFNPNECLTGPVHIQALVKDKKRDSTLPSVIPIGSPWQQIYLLARQQKKVYVEVFDLAPIKFTLSFSSAPWSLRNGILTSGNSLLHSGLMALADVEGAKIHLKPLTLAHHMAGWDSIQQITVRHYGRQILHEMYKVFASAGVIGNPMGFARSLGLGIKDFLSVPASSIWQSPTGIITGMARGTTSLLSNTVYALSDAAAQFTRAAHKGIVALTFDDHGAAKRETQQMTAAPNSKGVINEFLQGLTGLLQSPIRGAEKHGFPGVFSGLALGVTGLVARPAASILEVTGKTARSIRNRSKLYQMSSQRFRVRLPRPLSQELPLRPYSWEEAVAASVLADLEVGLRFQNEVVVTCKVLKQSGKFVIVTERLVVMVSCSSLLGLGSTEFRGVAMELQWVIEGEIWLEDVIHVDIEDGVMVHIVGSNSDGLLRQNLLRHRRSGGARTKQWSPPSTQSPLFQTELEFACKTVAERFLQILLSVIEQGKEHGWGVSSLLHQRNLS